MWGYIIAGAILGCRELVPSLYVRVYRFKPGDTRINYGSLIICEGISEHVQEAAEMLPFPHYMWGYILKIICYNYHVFVPSLYVRVYRTLEECEKFVERSLIICEGISGFLYCNYRPTKFPHYMWGYIPFSELYHIFNPVPSLYVMVYRLKKLVGTRSERSIIICEGISQEWVKPKMNFLFPHYMWGYISSASLFSFISFVPSLYVRVYRTSFSTLQTVSCSLIICEGISSWHSGNFTSPKFPHYMWVYIEIGNGILQASKNINVVDDSIPQIA